jgi:hypothetical protein
MIRLAAMVGASLLIAATAAAIVGGEVPGGIELGRHVLAVAGSNASVCTGTAIARELVLTAAHCVAAGFKFEVIELGGDETREIGVERFEQHPQFDFGAANAAHPSADVAVLKLEEPLSSRIVPVALGAREYFPAGDRFTIAGLGSEWDINDGTFGRLLVAHLAAVHSYSSLQLRLIDPVTRGERSGQGACSGDSGGPVFEDTSFGLVLVGVVSWAASVSGNPGCGGVTGATPIAPVRTWIVETSKLLGSPLGPMASDAVSRLARLSRRAAGQR